MNLAVVRLAIFLLLGACSLRSTLAADSTGKDASVTDLSTGNGAVYKLIDNGDGTMSPQFVFVSGGGAATQGKDYSIHDLTTGDALLVQLVDNGDGTKAPVVACPDCAGGGGGAISDTAYSSTTWNGDTTNGASKNALRDYFVAFDSDGDGKVDVLDQAAGIPLTNGSGVLQAPITDNSSNWNTAFTDRLKWDGGATGLVAATGRTSLGLVIGTNVAAAPTEQTVGDADATWLAGKYVLRATGAMTASRVNTMPAASAFVAGSIIMFVDKVTSATSTFVRSELAAGSDTINGSASYAPASGAVSVWFETDGVSNWTVVGTASQPAFTDMRDKLTDDEAALLVKPACAVVATSNLTLSGEQTIDGQLTSSSLVLATGQTTGSQNGPWISASGAWTRPGWYSSGSTVQAPRFLTTFIRLGTTYSGSTWRMTTASVTIDTTSTTWVQAQMAVNANSVSNGVTGSGAVVLAVSPTLTGHVTMEGVTPTGATGTGKQVYDTSPLLPSGFDLGNADTTITRSAAGIPAAEGLDLPPHYIIRAASTVTQANDASAHAIFTTPANGRFTAPLTGKYKFRGRFSWTSMSATSGNVKVDILGAGTATVTNWHWRSLGQDSASGGAGNTLSGGWFVTSASASNIANPATATACFVEVAGDCEVTVVGTLIPTQTMHDAAAAVLSVGSQFEIWREGTAGLTSTGPWD